MNGDRLVLEFYARGSGLGWRAYDGCNWVSGTATVGSQGVLAAVRRSTTLRGCLKDSGVAAWNATAVQEAHSAVLRGNDSLFLLAESGDELAAYTSTTGNVS